MCVMCVSDVCAQHMRVFVGSYLATVFIGNYRRGGPSSPVMNRKQLPANHINWDTLDHASCAPQLMSCTHVTIVCVCVCVVFH